MMGLGPPFCLECDMLADYHANIEDSTRQGKWKCPKCNEPVHGHLWLVSPKRRSIIEDYTHVYKNFNNPAK